MDSTPRTLDRPPHPDEQGYHHSRHLSLSNRRDLQGSSSSRAGASLRRGHSDGDVLDPRERASSLANSDTRPGPNRHFSPSSMLPRNQIGTDPGSDHDLRLGLAGTRERVELIMADRMRRMSRHQDIHSRQRSTSNLSLGSGRGGHRVRPGIVNPVAANPSHGHVIIPNNSITPGDLNRPLPQTPDTESIQRRRSREIKLPRWQPDAEVSSCPICHTSFSFWYRKHHCRKCGRVVCANCSPHRITIPRQFIVHQPDEVPGFPNQPREGTSQQTSSESRRQSFDSDEHPNSPEFGLDPALGGGQEVRLCNPCVPDPNPSPYSSFYSPGHQFGILNQTSNQPLSTEQDNRYEGQLQGLPNQSPSNRVRYRRVHRSDSSRGSGGNTSSNSSENDPYAYRPRHPYHHYRNSTELGSAFDPSAVYGSAPDQSHERYLESMRHRHGASNYPRHRHHASMGQMQNRSRPPWYRDLDLPSSRPVPQPLLKEEDECPVCHGALPPKGPDGSESAREEHVSACVESHFSTSGPRASQPPASSAILAAVAASAASPYQAGGSDTNNNIRMSSSSHSGPFSTPTFQQRRRTTGMVVYLATEKDCVGENGEGEAECVICFEEFAVGDEMGRLECLCKFHKKCIRQWWDTKGPGACPVHQQQEEI